MISKLLRFIPPFRGKQRIARLLLSQVLRNSRDKIVHGKLGCNYRIPNFNENIGFELLINGIYEKESIDFILSKLDSAKIFLDIGANIGAITIPVSKMKPGIRIVSVEASPWIINYLKENIALNSIENVTVVEKAISKTPGEDLNFYSPEDKFGKGSMAPVFTDKGTKVKTISIDKIAEQLSPNEIGFIKMDVEGFEYEAFLGGSETLKRRDAPDIFFEFVDWAETLAGVKPGSAQELLLNYGYQLYFLNKGKLRRNEKSLTKGSCMFFATKSSIR